jgi:hypothetical protein
VLVLDLATLLLLLQPGVKHALLSLADLLLLGSRGVDRFFSRGLWWLLAGDELVLLFFDDRLEGHERV